MTEPETDKQNREAIVYQISNSLYLNLTNRCSNQCEFCIRNYADGLAGKRLFLKREPNFEDCKKAIFPYLDQVNEMVFCGFGEPTYRLDLLVQICDWLKQKFRGKIRLNTNGLGNLINKFNIFRDLSGKLDRINVSLNASNSEEYQAICQSEFGLDAYPAVVEFVKEAKNHVPEVTISAVTASDVDMKKVEELADELGVLLRHR